MRLKDAFRILQPSTPTYAALRQALQNYQEKYPEEREDLLNIGKQAFQVLLEKDVYWFCDFDTLQAEIASSVPLDEVISDLHQKVSQWPGVDVEIRGIWLWISGETAGREDQLTALGFQYSEKKKQWYWRPAAGHPSTLN
jgi:hypothetical protein